MEYIGIFWTVLGSIVIGVVSNLASEPVKKYLASLSYSQKLKRIHFLEAEIKFMSKLSEDKSFFYHKSIERIFFLLKHGLIALGIALLAFSSFMMNQDAMFSIGSSYKFTPLVLTFGCGLYFTYIAGYTSSWYTRVRQLYRVERYIASVQAELYTLREKATK
ncbi:hypothetical protein [Vibrio parahaemolyticus]|uniref:hypothetical protein n=1 Tax=Vibrio parahaemolyticus TaxID=670 RepID=UPI00235EE98E|nr:hypothetical protein [Vibrio parahaemolyticus]MDF4820599.1 hypothetical protein [Vibrio parahaemolyticus]